MGPSPHIHSLYLRLFLPWTSYLTFVWLARGPHAGKGGPALMPTPCWDGNGLLWNHSVWEHTGCWLSPLDCLSGICYHLTTLLATKAGLQSHNGCLCGAPHAHPHVLGAPPLTLTRGFFAPTTVFSIPHPPLGV
ncbi:hypothetical protein EI94DRAFT_1703627 [Lactarius quietus]|nr:hypothetical protein EI94DRAFT_1703627 [Lactarius quietus]